jgi:Leucine-rich repeat (LRR) protein
LLNLQPPALFALFFKTKFMKHQLLIIFLFCFTAHAVAQQSMLELESGKHKIFHSVAEGLVEPEAVIILNLRQTELKALPEEVSQFKNLRFINVMKNGISGLPEGLFDLPELREINARENKIDRLSSKCGQLKKMVFLDLSKNALTSLPPQLKGMEKLEMLNVSENKLTNLPRQTGKMKSLRTLNVDKNKLETLPNSLSKIKQLEHFSAAYNQLTSIGTIAKNKHVVSINLQNNALSNLPNLSGTGSLKSLLLGFNQLTALPESICALTQLETLVVSFNPLTSLPQNIDKLTNLKSFIAVGTKLPESEIARARKLLPADCDMRFE